MSNQKDEKNKSQQSSEGPEEQSNQMPKANDNPEQSAAPAPNDGAKTENADQQEPESLPDTTEKKPFHFNTPIEELYDAADNKQTDDGEDGESTEQEEPALNKRRKLLHRLLYVTMLIVVSVLIATVVLSVFADRYGLGKPDQKVDVTIPRGATAGTIAEVLKKSGVISNEIGFRLFVRQNKISGFQAGVYTVNPSQGYEEIISVLRDPDQNKNNLTVTIPEGQTLQQVADLLNKKGVCTQQDFLNALDAGGFTFPLGAKIPSDPNRYYKYEGYLYPDTYTLLKDSSGKTAAQKMFSNFSAKFTPDMVQKAQQQGMTVDQIVTLASIIQKEAASKTVMADVSSAFYNRLRTGVNGKKLLQSDATVLYAKRDLTAALNSSDAALDSHYNTYRYEGLPPGPICNPGMDAIQAALNPNSTNYLYFVSDANGNYYFASNFADHVKNVKKAAKAGTPQATGDLSSGQ
ncbi:endolytic transglycosylase MltG [Ethanoligenens sp.]|uniref:endolytic transglycosylase MltG n=1 Tax=Ethanoligenens sp. TaxID=2099655 RepID=UPI0039E77811